MRIHSLWLEWLKTGPLLDPLRKEPRFQARARHAAICLIRSVTARWNVA
jgi:hypothetical protein